jgi:gamma-glutamyltranspeptidase/glutathione hydrolase
MFGLIQGEANKIQAGKRMLSSMCPIIVTRDERLVGLIGSPGGPKIITSVLQVLINIIDYNMTLPESVAAGRFHHQCLPDKIFIEKDRFDQKVLSQLQRWDYILQDVNQMGDIQAIWRVGDQWQLCSDPRGHGIPVGY